MPAKNELRDAWEATSHEAGVPIRAMRNAEGPGIVVSIDGNIVRECRTPGHALEYLIGLKHGVELERSKAEKAQ